MLKNLNKTSNESIKVTMRRVC